MTEYKPNIPAQQSDKELAIKGSKDNVKWFSAQLPDEYRCLLIGIVSVVNTIIVTDNENNNLKRFLFNGKKTHCY